MTGHDAYALFFLWRARIGKDTEHPSSPVMDLRRRSQNARVCATRVGV